MSPRRRKVEEGQHVFQLSLEFLYHLWSSPPPTSTESPRPLPRLHLILRVPDPPELPSKLPPLEPGQPWRQCFQVAEPVRQAALMSSRWIHRLGRMNNSCHSITHDQFHRLQPALP